MPRYVLVADDEPFIRRSLAFIFERSGYEVRTFANSQAALDLITSDAPAIGYLIADARLPTHGGLALVEHAREAGYAGPFMILGARGDSGLAAQQEAAEAQGGTWLCKPFAPSRLVEEVKASFPPESSSG
ncbi:MAG TPA: response regulator [archaeon]|nr:response regulator [archaeon]